MAVEFGYEVELTPTGNPDRVYNSIRTGIASYGSGAGPTTQLRSSYTLKQSETRRTMTLRASASSEVLGLRERGYAGLVMALTGTAFRDPEILRATLQNIAATDEKEYLPGPKYACDLLEPFSIPDPWISIPVPKSIANGNWKDVYRAIAEGGATSLTEMSLNLTAPEIRDRVDYLGSVVGRHFTLFLNGTGRSDYLLQIATLISDELRTRVNDVEVGIRFCPISVGYSALEHIRRMRIPIFAYTLGPIPSGDRGWSKTAYGQLLNLFGADITNIGLYTYAQLGQGTMNEMISGLEATNYAKRTIAAVNGGINPEMAYQYGQHVTAPHMLHSMSFVFENGPCYRSIRTRVAALTEAAGVGRDQLDVVRMFAARDARVKNWRSLK